MKRLNAGAWRTAPEGMRNAQMDPAALVRQTLARHGLGDGGGTGGDRAGGIIRDALARAGLGQGARGETAPDLPQGATFARGQHSGKSGTRAYRTYIPASASAGANGLVVMLHGCTQTPEDFALGTGMNAHAEAHRLIVIYPEQSRGANAQTCWNWFSKGDQARGRGEPEIIAGLTRQIAQHHGIAPRHTFVAGLSAGAAMAVILGHAYPDVFAAVGAHSGLPLGAAHDVPSAFAAMAGNGGVTRPPATFAPRTIVLHGANDSTVHPANGSAIAAMAEAGAKGPVLTSEERGTAGGRRYHRSLTWGAESQIHTEQWRIEGLGHAWSGGQPGGSYADPAGPDASAEMIRFFLQTDAKEELT
ncbi:extracellular catalytic domain type 1 short-chain-length polyhydroxyalkanoate depolymerase [Roseovarius nanhaiticus]|uniref:extracellular catalytic domain type 1 short-chain-length polyhydroxyalkanoate depolymerase n=1 Tax=Roseovarius nanhaiticus TaxID=573024 RepID=UPI002490CA49|nr:PHB depolymerase family esterase [Roseovarius nanhaiticus]